jgi:uncharacterized protein (TIGR03437 family)
MGPGIELPVPKGILLSRFLSVLFKQIAGPMNKMVLLFGTISCAFSQTAVISGVGNAASGSSYTVVPQMLVSIYGSNFAVQNGLANGSKLPTQLAGASVTFNGIAAPLLYVSPGQINAQVPSGLQGSASADVVVETPAGDSAVFPVTVTPMGITDASPLVTSFGSAPGIFTQDSSGCGQAAALNIHVDGSVTPNTPLTSFDPQKDWGFAIYLTGLGYFPDRADGVPWSYNAADNRSIQFGVSVGAVPGVAHSSVNLATSYAGPAPGSIGVDQINAMYTPMSNYFGPPFSVTMPEGCRMPLRVVGSGTTARFSQLANVSVHSGGGACTDTPVASLGIATWLQNMTSDAGGVSSTSSAAIQFFQGPGILGPDVLPMVSIPSEETYGSAPPPPAACADSYPATLSAGTLTLAGPGGSPVTLEPKYENGLISYQVPPFAGTVQAGQYSIADAGGAVAVGPFSARATLPAPITITTDLKPGTPISLPFTLNWTGGGADSIVTVQLNVLAPGQITTPLLLATSPATAGTRTLTMPVPPASVFSMPAGAGVEILVTQQPAQLPSFPFSAEGLTLGGQQLWNYVFEFKGLISQ